MRRVRTRAKHRVEVIGDATLYLGDCLDVAADVGLVDAVITDPPFEAEAHINQKRLGKDGFNNNPLDFAKNEAVC